MRSSSFPKSFSGFFIILSIGILLAHNYTSVSAQPLETTWAKSYGGSSHDSARAIQITSDGGYILAGETKSFGAGLTDAWVMKLDSIGNPEWQKTYGGHNHDEAWSVDQTADGGYIVAGVAQSFDIARRDAWLFKLNSSGEIEWERVYGTKQSEQFISVEETSDGGFILAGITDGFGYIPYTSYNSHAWIVKTDSQGIIEWEKTYGGGSEHWWQMERISSGVDWGFSVRETQDNGYIVSGQSTSFKVGSTGSAWLFKLDSSGNIIWETLFSDHVSSFTSVEPTTDGGYIATSGALIVKMDKDGNSEWEKGIWADYVTQTSDGGFVATGSTFQSEDSGRDISLVKLDSHGNIQLQKGYAGSETLFFNHVKQTLDEGYVISGSSTDGGYADVSILKVDSRGEFAGCEGYSVYDTNQTSSSAQSAFQKTTAEVTNSSAIAIESDADVNDIRFVMKTQCEPANSGNNYYSLSLFEDGTDPTDGFVDLASQVRAVAESNDPEVFEVKFRWINPTGEVVRSFGTGSVSAPIVSEQDFFAPNEQGTWVVEADFGNGQVIRKTLETSFFVLPESPIGAIGMMLASLGTLTTFAVLRLIRK